MCVGDSNERILNGPMQYNDSVWFRPSVPDLTNVRTINECTWIVLLYYLFIYLFIYLFVGYYTLKTSPVDQ